MLLVMLIVGEALCAMQAVAQAIMISRWHCMQFLLSILGRLLPYRLWMASFPCFGHGAHLGPASMVLLAAFPDSPRTSIAALACCLLGGQLDRLLQVKVLLARSRAELVENGQMLTRLIQLARLHIGNANVLMSADVLGV